MITIASLVVDIAANQASLIKSVEQVNTKLESISGIAAKVGAGLAAAFTITQVVGLGKQVIDFAGQLTDLAAKTGISTTGLQKLGAVFEQSGISLDTVSSATVKLAKSLIDGDKSTVGALEKLGLSVSDLKAMAPEQQFMKVADAIGTIQNPTEKAWAAMQIFGKGGAELLAGFDGHLQEAAQHAEDLGLIISEETVKAADDFGDQLGMMGKQLMGIVATVVGPLLPALSALGNILSWLGQNIIGPVLGGAIKVAMTILAGFVEVVTGLMARLAELGSRLPWVGDRFAAMAGALDSVSQKSGAYMADLWKIDDATKATGAAAGTLAPALIGLGKASETAAPKHEKQATALGAIGEKAMAAGLAMEAAVARGLFAVPGQDTFAALAAYQQQLATLPTLDAGPARTTIPALSGGANAVLAGLNGPGLSSVLAKVPQTITSALTGGGGMAGAAKAVASQFASHFGEKLGKGIAALGSIGGPLGSALGSLAGPLLGKVFGKLFSNPEKQVNPVRQAYIDAAGGLAQLDRTAHAAGATLTEILNAKTPEQYQRAIENLNQALKFQDDAMQTLSDTAKKYGFTIEELGPAFARQQLDQMAGTLYQDFQVLQAGGLGVDTILGRMGDSINEFVHSALKTGTEVPAAMQPMLQRMMELGQLTDANGNIITDLDAAGVHFSMTMTEGFQNVVKSVDKLTQAITRGLGLAIESIPQPEVTGRVHWEVDGLPGPIDPLDLNVPRFAKGGIVNGPTLAVIGEAGPEAVVPLSHPKGAVVAGGDSGGYREEFAAMRDHIERQGAMLARLPKDIARAVRDKRQLSLVRSRRAW